MHFLLISEIKKHFLKFKYYEKKYKKIKYKKTTSKMISYNKIIKIKFTDKYILSYVFYKVVSSI